MHFPLLVSNKIAFALEELCALFAIMLAQAWEIFYRFCILEFSKMLLVAEVGMDLVEIASVPSRLLLGVLSSDGRHIVGRLR